jgi:hypothetical protein
MTNSDIPFDTKVSPDTIVQWICLHASGVMAQMEFIGQFEFEDLMTPQPRQEPFKPAPRGAISTEQPLTSSPMASPQYEGPCSSLGEGLQEQLRKLQQCVHELLIKNQQLRISLESANESTNKGASPKECPQNIRRDQSHKRSL